jgi:hypothetical protein
MKKNILLIAISLIFIVLVSATTHSTITAATDALPETLNNTHVTYLPAINKPSNGYIPGEGGWPTVAGNLERTSSTTDEVTDSLTLRWYRPIEAYIPQNVQVIASNGFLFLATARGLYTINAQNGSIVWRFDTELPLGNSPTVANGVVYVGGYDRKLHALDAVSGTHLWSFAGAKAGYSTNPLLVNGVIYIGNRDGSMYAIGAHGTPNQGQLLWRYTTGDAIHLSAAYKDGVVYFASNDMHAYALNAQTGSLVWKSSKLPGMQFQSYWPVIYRDKVIFSVAPGYRDDRIPGTRNVSHPDNEIYGSYRQMQLADIFSGGSEGQIFGPEVSGQTWAHGFPVIDAHAITEYLEDNPQPDEYKHKPWRRMFVVLNRANGREFTFDSDQDGYPEFIPATYWGTGSGNRYPPVVGADNNLYFGNLYRCCSDAKGRIVGWNQDYPGYLSFIGRVNAPTGGFAAVAEPQAISVGGNVIYRSLCCDRVGDWANYTTPGLPARQIWSYNLDQLAPGYDSMWFVDPRAIARHVGWYTGNTNSMNAAYHNHGDQNPLVPYQDSVFVHRSNTLFAFGPGNGPGALPLLTINPGQNTSAPLAAPEIRNRLENEVQEMISAGNLRPGYYNASTIVRGVEEYFDNPGETLLALSLAYPHLSSGLQAQVRTYLQNEFSTYFQSQMYARRGWSGAPRESMELPPEVASALAAGSYPPSTNAGSGFLWQYPQHNFYAMWKYAQNVPGVDALVVYNLAKSRLVVPLPNPPGMSQVDYFRQQPYELNAWIAGYMGFLELQTLAGMAGNDAPLRSQVNQQLNALLQMRVNTFSKESYWSDPGAANYRYYKKHFDIVGNFLYLVPELGAYLRANIPNQAREAVNEYDYIAPYWFVSRYEATIGEGGMSLLYNYYALFQAKAFVLQESRQDLSKYLDVPAFTVGDLFYIQNLVALLEAPE